jgi:hypothetical protein
MLFRYPFSFFPNLLFVYSESNCVRSISYFPVIHDRISPDGNAAPLAGADANALGKLHDKDFSVADGACVRAAGDGVDGRLDKIFVYRDIQTDFVEQAARFPAAVIFRVRPLPSLPQHVVTSLIDSTLPASFEAQLWGR